jgi:hypothetical protein
LVNALLLLGKSQQPSCGYWPCTAQSRSVVFLCFGELTRATRRVAPRMYIEVDFAAVMLSKGWAKLMPFELRNMCHRDRYLQVEWTHKSCPPPLDYEVLAPEPWTLDPGPWTSVNASCFWVTGRYDDQFPNIVMQPSVLSAIWHRPVSALSTDTTLHTPVGGGSGGSGSRKPEVPVPTRCCDARALDIRMGTGAATC